MSDYRYPNITGKDSAEKLRQIESYLRQLVDKMNSESTSTSTYTQIYSAAKSGSGSKQKTEAEATFDEIKSLIIKSADIVDAFYETYTKKLSGHYVAQSEFGQFVEESTLELDATAKNVSVAMENVEAIESANGEFQDQVRQSLSELQQSAEQISIDVTSIINNGVDKVTTSKGYTFNAEGLRIKSAGTAIENLLNNRGMYVSRSEDVMLKADSNGVEATDVTVNNYLVVGEHARFEDYSDGNDTKRTGCFFVDEE